MIATKFVELTGLLDLAPHLNDAKEVQIYGTLYGQVIGQITIHLRTDLPANNQRNKQILTPFEDTFLVWTDLANQTEQIESWQALQNLIRYQLEVHPDLAPKPSEQSNSKVKSSFELIKAEAKKYLRGSIEVVRGLVSRTPKPTGQFALKQASGQDRNLDTKVKAASHARLGSIASAINRGLENRFSDKEKNWISRLETLRNTLSISTSEFEQLDFGARPDAESNPTDPYPRTITRTISEFYNSSCVTSRFALLLFSLIRELKPACCLELGTALGVSTAYQAAALDLNGYGKLVTLEGAPALMELAQANIKSLNLHNVSYTAGKFQDTLSMVLDKFQPFDFVFVDGHHDENATKLYFQIILPKLNNEAVMIFDDINWSEGMKRAWQNISNHPQVIASLDLARFGICIVNKTPSTQPSEHFFWFIKD